MYPKTPDAPHSAAPSCNQIEISPSWRAAILWFAWLLSLCLAILLGVELPLPIRLLICAAITATCVPLGWSCILIRGPRAVRRLDWSNDEIFTAFTGPGLTARPGTLARGSFRLGNEVLVLRLATAIGVRSVLIDSAVHEAASFRRLCRRLKTRPRPQAGGSGEAS
jgi:hypothetical protein